MSAVKLCRNLAPLLPGFARSKGVLYLPIADGLLRWISFCPTAHEKGTAYVNACYWPLFVPGDLNASIGKRLNNSGRFRTAPPGDPTVLGDIRRAILSEGLEFLSLATTPKALLNHLNLVAANGPDDVYALRVRAFCEAKLSRYVEAEETLRKLKWTLEEIIPGSPWAAQLIPECSRLSELVRQRSPEIAVWLDEVEASSRMKNGLNPGSG